MFLRKWEQGNNDFYFSKLLKMKKPKIHFIGVGVPRGGTTWINECLREHPELFIPVNKELNYFNEQEEFNDKSKYEIEGIKGYYKRFGNTHGLKSGEYSPAYFASEKAMRDIKKNFPNVKIIISLRNPAERFISNYTFGKNYFKWDLNQKTVNIYKEQGYYYKILQKWFKYFNKNQIKILIYEDIKKNPEKVVKELYSFLEIDDTYSPKSLYKKVNPQGIPKSNTLNFIQRWIPKTTRFLRRLKFYFLLNLLRDIGINKVYGMIWKTNVKPMELKEADKSMIKGLKKTYKSDIEKLEKLLNRKFTDWKN
jgi:hypothetical protein